MTATGRWLWLTAELPSAYTTGRLVYSASLAGALAESGIQIVMVGVGETPAPVDGIEWRPVPGSLRGGKRSLLSELPNLSYACATGPMRDEVRRLLRTRWDVVVIDHLQAAWAAREVANRHDGTVVFVTHNHEAGVRRRVAMATPLFSGRGAALRLDAWKSARLERAAARTADIVTSITEHDRRQLEMLAPSSEHLVLMPGWTGWIPPSAPPMGERPRRVGIVGSFDWHVKQTNLRTFLAAADRIFSDAGIEVVIGGKVPSDLRQEIEPDLLATRFVGWVEDLADLLADCRVGIVAERLGGGFKMKSLDYVFHRVAVAAVTGSITGFPPEASRYFIESGTSAGLAAEIAAVIDDVEWLEDATTKVFEVCCEEFTWQRRTHALLDAVEAATVNGDEP